MSNQAVVVTPSVAANTKMPISSSQTDSVGDWPRSIHSHIASRKMIGREMADGIVAYGFMRGLPCTRRAAHSCGSSQPTFHESEIAPISALSLVNPDASAISTVVIGMKYTPILKNIESPPKASWLRSKSRGTGFAAFVDTGGIIGGGSGWQVTHSMIYPLSLSTITIYYPLFSASAARTTARHRCRR